MADRWSPHPRYRLYTRLASHIPRLQPHHDAVREFEADVCRRFGASAAVCVPMARTGLFLTLLETIQPGRKVIMSPLTIVDVVNAVLLAGGIPVFSDICRRSCSLDPGKAESLIDKDTSAILITHLHGQTAGAHNFLDICARRGIALIEDAAQAFGAIENGRRLGTIGDAGIYSFGFFKNLSTWRGGMVVSQDLDLIERIRLRIQNFTEISRRRLLTTKLSGLIVNAATWPPVFSMLVYPVVRKRIGFIDRRLDPEAEAARLEEIPEDYLCRMRPSQACAGLRQLDQVDADSNARIAHANRYHDGLDDIPGVITPPRSEGLSNIYTYFPIQISNRQSILIHAHNRGRDFAAQHLRNCADLPAFKELYRDCPNAREAASELILLPAYPRYPEAEVRLNIDTIRELTLRL